MNEKTSKEQLLKKIQEITKCTDTTTEYVSLVIKGLEDQGKLDAVDLGALVLLANAYNLQLKANDELNKSTLLVENGNTLMKNPLVQIIVSCQGLCVRIMQDFGLTARSRKYLNKGEEKKEVEETPLDSFLKG